MTYFGVDSNTNVLLHSLIAKVTRMELALEVFQTNSKEGEGDPTLPKNFKELRELVMHLADIIVEQSKNINDLKTMYVESFSDTSHQSLGSREDDLKTMYAFSDTSHQSLGSREDDF
jgi:Mg2+ and Co2+ transporter CorA